MGNELPSAATLLAQAAQGNTESLFRLAMLGYWDYEEVPGEPKQRDIVRFLDAAGTNGDAGLCRKIGDFFHYEFQEEKAQEYYGKAFAKNLELAAKGDAEAQFALAQQYAFGKGVKQNDKNACFWCYLAACNKHQEAKYMMSNFWQDGGVLPISGEISQKWRKTANASGNNSIKLSGDIAKLQKATAKEGMIEEQIRIEEQRRKENKAEKYSIKDIRMLPHARFLNWLMEKLHSLLANGFIVYAVACVVCYCINFVFGHSESGLFHYVNVVYHFLLKIPGEWVMSLFSDYMVPGQITLEQFCEGMSLHDPIQALFAGVIYIAWLVIIFAAMCALAWGAEKLLDREGLLIEEVPASNKDTAARNEHLKALAQEQKEAKEILEALYVKHGIPKAMQNRTDILAICNLAYLKECDLETAVSIYKQMKEQPEEISESVELRSGKGSFSSMALYFILRRAGIPFQPSMGYGFPIDGTFMKAYTAYRRGKNFKEAKDGFTAVLEDGAVSKEEKGWAAWSLALLNRSEFCMRDYPYEKEHNAQCQEEAKRMENLAVSYGCPKAQADSASLAMLLWQSDAGALGTLAGYFEKSEPKLHKYLQEMAGQSLENMYACGNPLNQSQWQGYVTKCLWPEYKALKAAYESANKRFGADLSEYDETTAYQRQLAGMGPIYESCKDIVGKGLASADQLCEILAATVDLSQYVATREIKEQQEQRRREMAARDAAVAKEMARFDERADDIERSVNFGLSGSYATEFERALSGDISSNSYLRSDSLRYEARKQYQKTVESAYGSTQEE